MNTSWLFGHILIPAFETLLKRRRTLSYWRLLEESQWMPAAEIEKLQVLALRRLLAHASATCPYFAREWEKRELNAAGLGSLSDLERWPLLDRAAVAKHRYEMRSTCPESRLLEKATGGSSGVPLRFDYTEESYERRMAMWHRGYSWAGARPGVKQFYFWGVPLGDRPFRARLKDRVYNALYRHHVVSSFDFSQDKASVIAADLKRYRPHVIVAYTNPLYALARALEDRHIQPFSPEAIVLGAEKVHDFQRATIERVFRAPVFETYGSREFMLMAAECERHDGLHISAEHLIVEIVDEDGRLVEPGQEGAVAVTDLHNFAMPFVRYLNGDRAVASARRCSCGRGLPLLERIVGRTLDVITAPDGKRLAGEFFPHFLKDFPAIRQFQVVQDRPAAIVIKVVIQGDFANADRNRMRREIEDRLGASMNVSFEEVAEIPLTKAGKLLVVVNKLSGTATTC